MADVTSSSTFRHMIAGNRRWVFIDVPSGGTTADTVTTPLSFVEAAWPNFRGTTVGTSALPVLTVGGTTIAIFNPSTAVSFSITAVGR